MSEQNVETVRRIYEGFPVIQDGLRRGDFPISAPFAEDVEWDASEMGLPDLGDGHLRGREGVRHFWMVWLSAWENVNFDFELRDAGDSVVALIDQWMRGSKEVRIPTGRYAQVWTFSNGEIVRWKVYWKPAEALEAVGLAE
jgi:ketosteroid isomerase-like protein